MSHTHRAVSWTPFKRAYDAVLALALAVFLALFVGLGSSFYPNATLETLLIRSLGLAALLLLHVTLAIGPLCRLSPRFLPLLYNRRHLGVATFLVALAHGGFALFQFHALGNANPLVSVLSANPRWDSLTDFPFQPLGLGALLILLLMAATSHDFWLGVLTPAGWKRLHRLVYLAYLLIVGHVALGALQVQKSLVYPGLVACGAVTLAGLHLAARWRDRKRSGGEAPQREDFAEVCRLEAIPTGRARTARVSGHQVAVFRYDGRIAAVSNVCPHQHGPLGEGAVVDGLITCPWHGHQFQPGSGRAPTPYADCVPTFDVRLKGGRVWVRTRPNPAGSPAAVAEIERGE